MRFYFGERIVESILGDFCFCLWFFFGFYHWIPPATFVRFSAPGDSNLTTPDLLTMRPSVVFRWFVFIFFPWKLASAGPSIWLVEFDVQLAEPWCYMKTIELKRTQLNKHWLLTRHLLSDLRQIRTRRENLLQTTCRNQLSILGRTKINRQ